LAPRERDLDIYSISLFLFTLLYNQKGLMTPQDVISYLLQHCKVVVKLMEKEKVKGRASVNFGVFEVNGFLILKNELEEKYWVKPPTFPSVRAKGGRANIFFSNHTADFWVPLTELILKEFSKVLNSPAPDVIPEIDIDSIPY
jgi:hypothetical protein